MTTQFLNTFIYSLMAALSTGLGVFIVFRKIETISKHSMLMVSFSAGVILAVTFTHILPEAIYFTKDALTIILITLLFFYTLEHTISIHICREEGCEKHPMGVNAIMGIVFHAFLDGVVIGVGFEAGFEIGLLASLAILLHKLPVGITLTSLMLHSNIAISKVKFFGFLVSVITPIGAMFAYFMFKNADEEILGMALAFSAGSLLYIGLADLLPETHTKSSKMNIVLVLVGVILIYLVTYLTGLTLESHEGHAH